MSLVLVFLMMLSSTVTVNAVVENPMVYTGNDQHLDFEEILEYFGSYYSEEHIDFVEFNQSIIKNDKVTVSGFSVTFSDIETKEDETSEIISLNWSTSSKQVLFVSVKAGNGGNLYYYNPLSDGGFVEVPSNNSVSHLRFYYVDEDVDDDDDDDDDEDEDEDEDVNDEDIDDEDVDDEDVDDEDVDDEDVDDEDVDDEDVDDEDVDDEDVDDEDVDDEDVDDEDVEEETTTTRRRRVAVVEVPEIELEDEEIAEALPEPVMEEVVEVVAPIEEVILDEPIAEALPITILEDEELPQTGGIPLEALSLIGVALTGIGAVLRKKSS
ncbi:LPXTG cell wall anchor domain-containing protein [Petrocella sp. FN5]|uniref:LPXTG cell wall anchor domain-containing protein n=1 Tax=Petrocella sp. FN5 TaxID=3032002 RepID=UPI0023DA6CDB|nr:LPXTG cell wall anchor domain-containing protein [Petrocella sp. FN5]MDF1616622.1 LPXTG cell wall anchor domain-containing protein [Petrocella sp. FN5]